ncbi:rhomboid family intramembrane serine protease [Microbacterium sp. gxy059]|uniref:rhomboid family intramembrane serine protease n=1 Tax=Microbacterium sp. gxy059 TaxID=2957199 RepID=UPI003D99E784
MTSEQPTRRSEALTRLAQPAVLLLVMWGVHLLDAILPGSFTGLGLRSWDLSSVGGLVIGPLLHSSWSHLISNSVPLLVLGGLAALDGVKRFWTVTAIIALVSGVGTWFVNAPGTLTVGASGLVFGYFGYLLARAFVAPSRGRGILYAIIAVAVALSYGGAMLTGVFGAPAGISWQAHLFGAIGGTVAAWTLRPERHRRPVEGR